MTLLEDLLLLGTLLGRSGRDQVSSCHFKALSQGKRLYVGDCLYKAFVLVDLSSAVLMVWKGLPG